MDWSNERYVRLYIRDTTSWRRLGWDGQCILMALLRKVDRSGTLDLDNLEPWEGVALHTGAPEEAARNGVAAMVKVGVVVVNGARLVFPNFIEAQECTKSESLRAREYRERRAQEIVTKSDAPSREVTPPSQVEQDRPSASRLVTQYCTVPSRTEEESAPPLAAHPAEAGHQLIKVQPANDLERRATPRKPVAPRPANPAFDAVVDLLRAEYGRRFRPEACPDKFEGGLIGKVLKWSGGNVDLTRRSLVAFLDDPFWKSEGSDYRAWAGNPAKYLRKAEVAAGPATPAFDRSIVK